MPTININVPGVTVVVNNDSIDINPSYQQGTPYPFEPHFSWRRFDTPPPPYPSQQQMPQQPSTEVCVKPHTDLRNDVDQSRPCRQPYAKSSGLVYRPDIIKFINSFIEKSVDTVVNLQVVPLTGKALNWTDIKFSIGNEESFLHYGINSKIVLNVKCYDENNNLIKISMFSWVNKNNDVWEIHDQDSWTFDANAVFMSHPSVSEEGFVISESFAQRAGLRVDTNV